jgi:PEP-CTERM motif
MGLAQLSPAVATTYDVNFPLLPDPIVGHITTDCDLCTVTTSDITDWFFTSPFIVSPGGASVTGFPLHANSFELQFDFDGSTGNLIFTDGFGEICFSDRSLSCSPSQTHSGIMVEQFRGNFTQSFFDVSGLLQIAVAEPVTAVPEPSTWAMLLLGFLGLGLLGYRRKAWPHALP